MPYMASTRAFTNIEIRAPFRAFFSLTAASKNEGGGVYLRWKTASGKKAPGAPSAYCRTTSAEGSRSRSFDSACSAVRCSCLHARRFATRRFFACRFEAATIEARNSRRTRRPPEWASMS